MASHDSLNNMTESAMTIPSDSEQYSGNDELSPSPPFSESSPAMILYSPPTVWGLLRGAAINLLLPFVNGLMLGFGELFAHEAAFRLGWGGTKVQQFFNVILTLLSVITLLISCPVAPGGLRDASRDQFQRITADSPST